MVLGMRRVARLAYGVFGVLAICLSAIALLKPAFVLSDEVYSPLTAHLIREQGAQGIFHRNHGFVVFFQL